MKISNTIRVHTKRSKISSFGVLGIARAVAHSLGAEIEEAVAAREGRNGVRAVVVLAAARVGRGGRAQLRRVDRQVPDAAPEGAADAREATRRSGLSVGRIAVHRAVLVARHRVAPASRRRDLCRPSCGTCGCFWRTLAGHEASID